MDVIEHLHATKRIDIDHYFFASVEWRCPKCNYSIELRSLYVSLGIRLGQEVEKCLRCGQWLSLGKREWRNLSAAGVLCFTWRAPSNSVFRFHNVHRLG